MLIALALSAPLAAQEAGEAPAASSQDIADLDKVCKYIDLPLQHASDAVLKRMNRDDITVHGFRSCFRDWAGEVSSFPNEVCEMALAHTIRNKAEAAYRRGGLRAECRVHADLGQCRREPSGSESGPR